MARPLQIEFAGALYHVTSRGDGREDIYLDDKDREIFLCVLENVSERFNHRGFDSPSLATNTQVGLHILPWMAGIRAMQEQLPKR